MKFYAKMHSPRFILKIFQIELFVINSTDHNRIHNERESDLHKISPHIYRYFFCIILKIR